MTLVSLIRELKSNKAFLFLVVGGTTTLLQFALLVTIVELTVIHPVAGSALSYACAGVYNYFLNYYLTFASNKNHWDTFSKFLVVVCIGLCVNTFVFSIIEIVSPYYLISQLVATLISVVVNFFLHKCWIYR